LEYGATERD